MMDERHSQHLTQIMREFGTYMQAQNAPRPGHSKLQDFQRTQPPKFSFADDPLEADDWLRTIEKKLELARVDELDKVLFSTHYLEGPANVWWDNQKTARGDGPPATWTEFQEAFRKAYIPSSLIKMKQQEFLALTQGNQSISEYLTKFNNLARYAPDDTNTEEKKKDRFLQGMHQAIKTQLSVLQFQDFQAMINTALISEKEHRTIYDSHKRKFEPRKNHQEGTSSKPRTWQPSNPTPNPQTTGNQPKKDGYPREGFYHQRPIADDAKRGNACFKCGKAGHYIRECPLNNNPGNNSNFNNNHPASAVKAPQVARVHHMSAEEAYEATNAALGTCTEPR